MSEATQAVVLNGVPLILLAAAYAAVSVAVLPALLQDRGGAHPLDWAVALLFPSIAFAAGVFGILTVSERRPLAGHTWISLATTLAAFLPVLPILVHWRERAFLARGVSRSLVAEERASSRDRELAAVSEISVALARARTPLDVARPLAAHVARLLGVGFVGVALVGEDESEAHGVYAETSGRTASWWAETKVDLRGEPSGIARAYFDAEPVIVYDIAMSSLVSPRLATLVGAHSGVWVPMITEERVVGVLVLATTDQKRAFLPEELSLLQAVAAEAAIAFERLRSATALADALEREQRAAEIVRRLRAELEPEDVVRVARQELRTALALDAINVDVSGEEARVDVERADPLTDSERTLVENVRYEIGAAVRTAALLAGHSRQARVQRGFYRIATLLGEPVAPEEAYDAAAQAATEALGGDFAAVLAAGADGLVAVGGYDLRREVRELPIPQAFVDAAEDGHMLAAPEVAGDARFAAWSHVPFSSLLAIPVRGEQEELVVVFFASTHSFSADDLELARRVAGAARGAFERSRLFEAERTARSLSQQLARTGSLLATKLDPDVVLGTVVAEAANLLRADAAALMTLDDREVVVAAAVGDGAEELIGARSPAASSAAGDVIRSRAPAVHHETSKHASVFESDAFLAAGHASYLGVPLTAPDGGLHGVLSVYSRSARVWREEEVQALLALAANAAAALTNAELYQRVALEREQSVAILANIADGIVAVDRDGHVVLWNRAAEAITGVPTSEAVGRTPSQVLQRELESELGGTNRLVAIKRGEEDVWLSLSETVMRDPAGAAAGRIFAFRDISAEHELEQMKSDFVSTVSVALRTPLTSIYGFAQTLLREDVTFSEAERHTFLDFIARESEGLTTIVDALLNAARLDNGDLRVTLEPTDVGGVVQNVVATAGHAPGNGHRFVADVDGSAGHAQADPDKLRQVLDQLVENAVKYSPGGGTVTVSVERRADAIEIAVADEGVGIAAGDVDRIFSKFTKISSGPGTGLGLFIARGLVREMGGRMWVESTEGVGARFVFALAPVEDV